MPRKTPPAPAHLRPSTRTWWLQVHRDFALEAHHTKLLTLAGEAWDRCAAARKILDRDGLTFADRFGQPKPRPEVAIERDSRVAFARMLRELGLDVAQPGESRAPAAPANSHLRAV